MTGALNGNKSWSAIRESFGKTTVQAGASTSYLMRFPGQWEDSISKTFQNYRRDYFVSSSRYGTVDPLLSFEFYSYASRNPISSFDANGLFTSGMFESPKVHGFITYRAYQIAKIPECEDGDDVRRKAIQWSDDYDDPDLVPGSQDIDMAHTHAMTPMTKATMEVDFSHGPPLAEDVKQIPAQYGSKSLARIMWLHFILENASKCTGTGLGYALHALQDHYAKGHADFEYWGGGIPSVSHLIADTGPDKENLHGAIFASADLIELFYRTCKSQCCN